MIMFRYQCFYGILYVSYCSIETITLGDKRIGIKTSVLEEKATACNMLCCYADELKEGFFPWIEQVWLDLHFRGFFLLCFYFILKIFLDPSGAYFEGSQKYDTDYEYV